MQFLPNLALFLSLVSEYQALQRKLYGHTSKSKVVSSTYSPPENNNNSRYQI